MPCYQYLSCGMVKCQLIELDPKGGSNFVVGIVEPLVDVGARELQIGHHYPIEVSHPVLHAA
jgi:hypothetical protein